MRRNISSVLVVIVGVILAVDVVVRLAPQEAATALVIQEPWAFTLWSTGEITKSFTASVPHPSVKNNSGGTLP